MAMTMTIFNRATIDQGYFLIRAIIDRG